MPVVSVMGTKGGVGKSTVAMGVAAWLSKIQDDLVLLIDGDIHVRTVELKMCPKTDITFAEVLEGQSDLVDAIYRCQLKAGKKWLYPHLSILPAGGRFLPPGSRNIEKFVADTVTKFDKVMKRLREYFAYIVVDTPASMSFEHFILTAIADGLIFVVTPDVPSVFSSRQTSIGLKEMMGIQTTGTVMNKVPYRMLAREVWKDYAGTIAPIMGTLPYDELVNESFRRNLPVVAAYPRSETSVQMKKVARGIIKKNLKATNVVPKFKKSWTQLWTKRKAFEKRFEKLEKEKPKKPKFSKK